MPVEGSLSPRKIRPLGELHRVVDEVDERLGAICALLKLARQGGTIQASTMHALLSPLQSQLSSACDDIADIEQ